jgi:membrane protein
MTTEAYVFLFVVAAVVAAVGQGMAGFTVGGCLVSIALGFVGALVGGWAQGEFRLQEPVPFTVGEHTFPLVWSIIGAALFVSIVSLISGRGAKNLWHKASHDQIFFLSSGITFNVLVTIVPLLLLSISILGMLVESSGAARDQVLAFIQRAMPLAGNQADSLLSSLVEDRGLFGLIGSVGLIWAATRLFGSLRTVLEVVFEIPPEDRLGIVEGKIHDVRMVIIVGTLFVATISLTTGLQWVEDYGIPFLGLEAYDLSRVTAFGSMLMAFSITYLMFYFVYRYVPDRWIPRTDAAIAALFSSLLFELAKQVFIAFSCWAVSWHASYKSIVARESSQRGGSGGRCLEPSVGGRRRLPGVDDHHRNRHRSDARLVN